MKRDPLDAIAERLRAQGGVSDAEGWHGTRTRPTGEDVWASLTVRLPRSVLSIVEAERDRLMGLGLDEVNAWEYMAVLSSLTPVESVT
jgi:hypothetical protein